MNAELPIPKLLGVSDTPWWLLFGCTGGRAGYWPTACGRFVITHALNLRPAGPQTWVVVPRRDSADGHQILRRQGLDPVRCRFTTRREALEALALALHLDGER